MIKIKNELTMFVKLLPFLHYIIHVDLFYCNILYMNLKAVDSSMPLILFIY